MAMMSPPIAARAFLSKLQQNANGTYGSEVREKMGTKQAFKRQSALR
jgi:hypothetical protein